MKQFYTALRIVLGLVFVFSGYVKAVDPWGTSIKFDEYFEAMGLPMFHSISMILSNALSFLELLLGYLLVFHIRPKWATRMTFLMMCFFTPLTLWLAVTGKVTDCGCFGDALKMTDWQTFYKNVALISVAIIVLILSRKYSSTIADKKQRLLFILGGLFSVGIVWFSYQHLPLIDFRPFKVGSDIQKSMEIPEGAATDEYATTLKYEKDGEVKEFTQENYPWQDTTWHYVSSEQLLIKKGYEPPITDFYIESWEGEDVTNAILEAEKCLLIITYKVEKVDFVGKYKETGLQNLVQLANAEQVPVYLLTASIPEQVENIRAYIPEPINCCFADEKVLKTVVRANPGVVLLNNAVVVDKWNVNDLRPKITFDRKVANAEELKTKTYQNQVNLSIALLVILGVVSLVLIKMPKRKRLAEEAGE